MPRLPQPGKDAGEWGAILNDYLSVAHKADGTLSDNSVTNGILALASVTDAKIAPGISQSKVTNLTTDLSAKLTAASNLSDIPVPAMARTNLGLGASATMSPVQIAGDAALTSAYATKERLRCAAAAASVRDSLSTISSLSPTVTVTHSSTTTIAGSQRITPMRNALGTTADTIHDPHFSWAEGPEGKVVIAAGDAYYGDEMIGGVAGGSGRRWNPRPQFIHDGSVFEVWIRATSTLLRFRIWVDGLPLTATVVSEATSNPDNVLIKVNFGSTGSRHIEIETDGAQFKGVFVGITDTVRRADTGMPVLAGFGDSHTAGANGVTAPETWVGHASRLLGCQSANLGIGGSAFDAVRQVEPDRFRLRIPDLIAAQPDAIAFLCGANDVIDNNVTAFQAEATYVLGQIKTALPSTLVVVFGLYHTNSHNVYSIGSSYDNALKTAAEINGYPFQSFMDSADIVDTLPTWAISTLYWPGSYVQHLGYPYICHTYHTSASSGSIDLTKFRAATIWRGTGKAGATTGDGANDLLLSSDGLHLTAQGHRVMGKVIASAFMRAIKS